jgi:hypothetical protein
MNAKGALVAVPTNQRRIRGLRRVRHLWISDKIGPTRWRAQKKWLAGAAANHLSDSPLELPHRNRQKSAKQAKVKTTGYRLSYVTP